MPEQSTDSLLRFDSREQNRRIALQLLRGARRTLDLMSRHLEPEIYDHETAIEQFIRLATENRLCRIRILVQDSRQVMLGGHRLVEAGRRLTSCIEFRRPGKEHQDDPCACLLADRSGYLYKKDSYCFSGEANLHDPLKTDELKQRFDEIWENADPDMELRRLHL